MIKCVLIGFREGNTRKKEEREEAKTHKTTTTTTTQKPEKILKVTKIILNWTRGWRTDS